MVTATVTSFDVTNINAGTAAIKTLGFASGDELVTATSGNTLFIYRVQP